jgi:hypothetical protein
VLVLIGLGIAVGVIVVLFLLTKLVRSVQSEDEFGLGRARRFPWRSRSGPSLVVPFPPTQDPSSGSADLPAPRAGTLERLAAYAPTKGSKGSAQMSAPSVPSRRSVSVKQSGQSKAENARRSDQRVSAAQQQARNERNPESGSTDYVRLGEQVTAVLTTAEQAAAEIRESANRDAEHIRGEAKKQAAAFKAQAEALRADADAYAEQKRRTADAQAEEARVALEKRATAIQAEAERKAKEIETEAIRRRDVLRQSTARLEERIAETLATFRGMTSDLEGLLPAARRREDGKPQDADGVAVDDTLENALKPERAL